MPDRTTLHRYELLPDRRVRDRRGDDRATPNRRASDRRGSGSLLAAPAVRRIFPIAEGTAPDHIRAREQVVRTALLLGDALALAVAFAIVAVQGSVAPPVLGVAAVLLGALALLTVAGCYRGDDVVLRRSTLDEVPKLGQLAGLTALVYWIAINPQFGRWELLGLWAGVAAALIGTRFLVRVVVRRLLPAERCLLIGDADVGEHVRRKVGTSRANAEVVAAVELRPDQTAEDLGGIDGVRALVEDDLIDRVILAPTTTDAIGHLELVRVCKLVGVRVSVLPRLFEVVGSSVEFDDIDGLTILGVRRFGLSPTSRVMKRAFDLVGSSLALLLFAPVMAVIALAIRLDSSGSVLFRQVRVGRDGEHFCIYKFRSMEDDAEARRAELEEHNEAEGGLFKMTADPRVTRVGRFLRKTSLDELPQLLNVVRGEMSLVGPRPLVLHEDSQILGLDRQRLHLTPGMTGPWQILGSARVPMQEMVGMDYIYVANWSLWTDLKLLLRTVFHVLARDNV